MQLDPGAVNIAVAVIVNSAGRMLVVRKRNNSVFIQPGGKIDAGETPELALRRELIEEIDFPLASAPRFAGVFSDKAANEPGMMVVAHAFLVRSDIAVTPRAEIEEVRWISLDGEETTPLAALSRNAMVPLARAFRDGEP